MLTPRRVWLREMLQKDYMLGQSQHQAEVISELATQSVRKTDDFGPRSGSLEWPIKPRCRGLGEMSLSSELIALGDCTFTARRYRVRIAAVDKIVTHHIECACAIGVRDNTALHVGPKRADEVVLETVL